MSEKDINKRFKQIVESKNKQPRSHFIFLFSLLIILIFILLLIWKYYSKKINNLDKSNSITTSSTSDRTWLNDVDKRK